MVCEQRLLIVSKTVGTRPPGQRYGRAGRLLFAQSLIWRAAYCRASPAAEVDVWGHSPYARSAANYPRVKLARQPHATAVDTGQRTGTYSLRVKVALPSRECGSQERHYVRGLPNSACKYLSRRGGC